MRFLVPQRFFERSEIGYFPYLYGVYKVLWAVDLVRENKEIPNCAANFFRKNDSSPRSDGLFV